MRLPISGSQLKKLTRRLRDGAEIPEDLHYLADLLIYYRRVLASAHANVIDQLERGLFDDEFGREIAVLARESVRTVLAEIADQLEDWKAVT